MKKSLLTAAMLALVALPALAFAFDPAVALAAIGADWLQTALQSPEGVTLAMATLAANKPRAYELGDEQHYPVVASDIIYEGAAVGENGSGYARPLVALDPFLGFATRTIDNSAGAAGAKNVEVKRRGQIQLPVAGATAVTANDGPLVYASDDDTFTLTSTSNTAIGRVARWISSGVCIVAFDASRPAV